MPTSFSRILNEDDLDQMRNQYLAALEALEADEEADEEPAAEEPAAGEA